MKKMLAVYDDDPVFTSRLVRRISEREHMPFRAEAFTSPELLKERLMMQRAELLLLGEETDAESVLELHRGMVVYLGEEKRGFKTPRVYKYQPVDQIVREIMACYCEAHREGTDILPAQKSGAVAGVYSPAGRCGKSLFALALGRALSEEQSTLYLTFEELSALELWMGETYTAGLTDLLYANRRGALTEAKIDSVLYSWGPLYYVPPAAYPEDLAEVSGEEAAQLVCRIGAGKDFERIVVDIGSCGKRVIPLMELCSVIYVPIPGDSVSSEKLRLFENYLKACGKEDLLEQMEVITVSADNGYAGREDTPDAAFWGAAGERIRMLLKGERLCKGKW